METGRSITQRRKRRGQKVRTRVEGLDALAVSAVYSVITEITEKTIRWGFAVRLRGENE
jgi:hypothetical protein